MVRVVEFGEGIELSMEKTWVSDCNVKRAEEAIGGILLLYGGLRGIGREI